MQPIASEGEPAPRGEIEELLAECIDVAESQGPAAVEALLARHPEHAADLRRWLTRLTGMGLSSPPPGEHPAIPARLGGYRILEQLGAGGMGVVYLAEDEALKRRVALKVIAPGLDGSAARFVREAQVVARLNHRNVVAIYGSGHDQGLVYIAMELVEGRGLDEIYRDAAERHTRVPIADLVRWCRDVARGLECAHQAGAIHRDVKPSNVRIAADGRAVLLDFGLARDLAAPTLSRTGAFLGSPLYSSPEQVAGDHARVGPPTDVYALGITLYEGVTGSAPFAGTCEQVFRAVLTEEPEPPRRRTAVPRDLESVILKAIDKDPARRYQGAGTLADDLDAILEFRPVRARAPGLLLRASKWCRRNRVAAGALATAALAAVAFLVYLGIAAQAAQRRAAAQARAWVEEAVRQRSDLASKGSAVEAIEARHVQLVRSLGSRYLTPAETAELDRGEEVLRTARRDRERTFYEALRLVADALKLDPEVEGARAARALLHFDRMRAALAARDLPTAAFYRDLVRQDDPEGRIELAAQAKVSFTTEPAGAEVHLFAYREQADVFDGGEPRLVPVPVRGPMPAVRPGTWALRVVQPAGEFAAEDLIVEVGGHGIEGTVLVSAGSGDVAPLDRLVAIDGKPVRDLFDVEPGDVAYPRPRAAPAERVFAFERQGKRREVRGASLRALGIEVATPLQVARQGAVPARVWRRGALLATVLPASLDLRVTTQPLLVAPSSSLGTTPIADAALEAGTYLAVVLRPGCEVARVPLHLDPAATPALAVALTLDARGTAPAGFVPLPRQPDQEQVWIMEREVTCAEYLAFLNDPATLAAVRASPVPIRFPRDEENKLRGGEWPRGADGCFRLADGWRPDLPVVGISWQDAQAYALWQTQRAAADGAPFRFSIPTTKEFQRAAHGGLERVHVFGDRFRAHWIKSCFARSVPCIEPVLSFPVDESPFGVFDLAGGMCEWAEDWYWEATAQRALVGGSWAQGDPICFRVDAANGGGETFTNGTTGLRLVARRH